MKKLSILISCLFASTFVGFAQDTTKIVQEPKVTVKPYGFVRSYFTFDSRESKSGTDELYYYLPLDESIQADGTDINEHPTTKWTAITSRIGLDIKGYQVGRIRVAGKFEADFYSGLSGVTGTAQFRLRQAFVTMQHGGGKNPSVLKIGQAWHPMAADMPHTTALEIGVPFGPFSRTPQITYDYSLLDAFRFTVSALWQMQYTSGGPEGSSANYIKYSNVPEFYFGLTYQNENGLLGRAGLDLLSIKPRYKGPVTSSINGSDSTYTGLVSDRLTTVTPFVYVQYTKNAFAFKVKSVYAQSGEHLNMNGGYGVTEKCTQSGEDGHWEYTPTRVSSSWMSLSYGKKWQAVLFAGYAKNYGTAEKLIVDYTAPDGTEYASVANNYLAKNTYANVNSMWRIAPEVIRNWGKLALSLEWQITSVQYGSFLKNAGVNYVKASNGLADDNLHWITNHRLQMMVKYSF